MSDLRVDFQDRLHWLMPWSGRS